MASQTDINATFRAILTDWLVQVHLKFKLEAATLFLTISIVDRFLEKKLITRTNLQLVGIAGKSLVNVLILLSSTVKRFIAALVFMCSCSSPDRFQV